MYLHVPTAPSLLGSVDVRAQVDTLHVDVIARVPIQEPGHGGGTVACRGQEPGEVDESDVRDQHVGGAGEGAVISAVLVDVRANGSTFDVEVLEAKVIDDTLRSSSIRGGTAMHLGTS